MKLEETCNGCKWLVDNNIWCDMKRSGRHKNDPRCSYYDSTIRRFEPKQFYIMCKRFVEMYNDFEGNTSYMKSENEKFNHLECEFLSFILNDIKREIKYYKNYELYEDLNQK